MELTQWLVPYEASSTYELFRAAVNSSADISLWQCEVTVTLRCSFLVKIRWQYEHWKSASVVGSAFAIMYCTWCHARVVEANVGIVGCTAQDPHA